MTFYKCDKCSKNMKEKAVGFSFEDIKRKFFENSFNRFELCEECAKPLADYVNRYLANKKINKNNKK